jgi:hypothetical protein
MMAATSANPPKLDGTDVWPVAADSLLDPSDISSVVTAALTSYLVDDTWVGHVQGELRLRILVSKPLSTSGDPAMTTELVLPIMNPTLTMKLDPTHTAAAHGVIAGVIAAERMQDAVTLVLRTWEPATLCFASSLDSTRTLVAQASDILTDATQDPAKTCDAISIGIGFDAVAVHLGPVQSMEKPLPPCCTPELSCAGALDPAATTIPCYTEAWMAYGALFDCACPLACAAACADSLCAGKGPAPTCSACLSGSCGADLQACMNN